MPRLYQGGIPAAGHHHHHQLHHSSSQATTTTTTSSHPLPSLTSSQTTTQSSSSTPQTTNASHSQYFPSQVHAVRVKQEAISRPQSPSVLNNNTAAIKNEVNTIKGESSSTLLPQIKREALPPAAVPNPSFDQQQPPASPEPLCDNLDIKISNVVCKYRVRCHIPLQKLAQQAFNTEYDRQRGRVMMRLRDPPCYANIWSSGKISIYGATSELNCEKGARRIAKYMKTKLGLEIRMCCFEIVNCLGSCKLSFGVRLDQFASDNKGPCVYEPELHAAANFKIASTGANIKIYQNGAMAGTAKNVQTLSEGIQEIYPLLEKFRKERPPTDEESGDDLADAESEFMGKHETGLDDLDKPSGKKTTKKGKKKAATPRKKKKATTEKKPAVKKPRQPKPKVAAPARKRRGGKKAAPAKKPKTQAVSDEDEEDVISSSELSDSDSEEEFVNGISAMPRAKTTKLKENTSRDSDQDLSQRLSQQRSISGRPPPPHSHLSQTSSSSQQQNFNYVPPTPRMHSNYDGY